MIISYKEKPTDYQIVEAINDKHATLLAAKKMT